MNIYLIDDHQRSLDMLTMLLNEIQDVVIVGTETNPTIGRDNLLMGAIEADVLFVDVEMPGLSGIEIIEQLKETEILTVLTTGHNNFGPEAVKNNVIAYLMKPVDVSELKECIDIARKILLERSKLIYVQPAPLCFVPGSGKGERIRIFTDDVLYVEGYDKFSKIFCINKRIVTTYLMLKNVQELLPEPGFLRIHRSTIINISKMVRYTSSFVYLESGLKPDYERSRELDARQRSELERNSEIELDFSDKYKKEFIDKIKRYGLVF